MSTNEETTVSPPARKPREGWDAAFKRMAAAGDDALLVPDSFEHDWDEEEGAW